MSDYYIVFNKGDDYDNCRTELVQTTSDNAKKYYSCKKVKKEHAEVLKQYFTLVPEQEELERSDDERFYGASNE